MIATGIYHRPKTPTFSLCHATCRLPTAWQAAARAWRENADNPLALEYILCVHENDIQRLPLTERDLAGQVVINHYRSCSVDNWNRAAEASHGQILLTIADDWFAPLHWDSHLLSVIPDPTKEACVWVATGGNNDLMQFSILTRPYYQRYGRIFYPEYESVFSDNDFQAQAEKDNVLLDCRKTLPEFPHKHPSFKRGTWDDTYAKQNRPEAYALGKEVFKRRKAQGFSD